MNLGTAHLVFVLFAIMGADLFGGWAVYEYRSTNDVSILILGLASMAGGLGLAGYVIRFVRMIDRTRVR